MRNDLAKLWGQGSTVKAGGWCAGRAVQFQLLLLLLLLLQLTLCRPS